MKRPWLASQQQSVAVVDLSNECSIVWKPHQQLLSGNITVLDVPGDGNCLVYACISKLQNCTTFTIEQARTMRNNLMDYLLLHADEPSGDLGSLIWRDLAMLHAPEIENEMRRKAFFRDPIVSTLNQYAHYMRIATENRCIYANTPELFLVTWRYSLNIAVYQVDPRRSMYYVLIQDVVGNPNNIKNVVYLLLHGVHYQRIITGDQSYSDNDHLLLHLDNTLTDFSAMDESYQDDTAMGQNYKSIDINEESTSNSIQDLDTVRVLDDSFCHVCNDDSNSIDSQALSTSVQSLNFTQELSHENVSNDETPVAAAIIPEATNDPIVMNDFALARE